MAVDIHKPSRRGFLGLFAAASAAAAVPIAAAIPAAQNWRTKPVAEWTQADLIAEAEFELAAHTREAKEVFHVGMSHHDRQLYECHLQFQRWWEIELMERRGYFA